MLSLRHCTENIDTETIIKTIQTSAAPAAIGPYSQAIAIDRLVFCSGQIPLTPEGTVAGTDIESQAEQVFRNIRAILKEAGTDLGHVVKATVFVKDLNDFGKLNAVYERNFGAHKPARSTVEVSRLPRDVLVEIEVIAQLP